MIIHAKEPFFQKNKDKFQEMLNDVKKMKNIMHNFDNTDSISKTKVSMKKNFCPKKRVDFNTKNVEKLNKTTINIITEKNKENINNDFLLNNEQLFNDDHYMDWPNSLNSLNDIMSSTADCSLKEENNTKENNLINFGKNDFSFQIVQDTVEKDVNFTLNNKLNNYNLYFNNADEKKFDENHENNENNENNEDCCSKMTNLYVQEFYDKKIENEFLV